MQKLLSSCLHFSFFNDDAGLVQEPKYSHLKQLHLAIKQCETALVSSDPTVTKLGNYEQAHVFSAGKGSCVAFLSNYHVNAPAKVVFNKRHYDLPAWSISILPDCSNVVFNTATVCIQDSCVKPSSCILKKLNLKLLKQVGAKTSNVQMVPSGSALYSVSRYDEDIATYGDRGTITALGLLEQINVTRDTSDYLWYITRYVFLNLIVSKHDLSVVLGETNRIGFLWRGFLQC